MSNIQNTLFGSLAIKTGLVSKEQLMQGLEYQKKCKKNGHKVPRMGEYLAAQKILTIPQVKKILIEQKKIQAKLKNTTKTMSKGDVFGNYKILQFLGQDTSWHTYKATNIETESDILLKVLTKEFSEDKEYLTEFKSSIKKSASLRHDNILHTIASGEFNGQQYYTSEYSKGKSLKNVLEEINYLEITDALKMINDIASALEYGHARGVFHQQINLSNIIYSEDGNFKLAGYGTVARPINNLENLVEICGDVPFFVAPEQAIEQEEARADSRTDIYSLGAVAYMALSGEPPFHGDSVAEVLLAIAETEAASIMSIAPDLPEDVCELVHKMIEVDPDERIQSAFELKEITEKILTSMSSTKNLPSKSSSKNTTTRTTNRKTKNSKVISRSSRHKKKSINRKKLTPQRMHSAKHKAKEESNLVLYIVIAAIIIIGGAFYYVHKQEQEEYEKEQQAIEIAQKEEELRQQKLKFERQKKYMLKKQKLEKEKLAREMDTRPKPNPQSKEQPNPAKEANPEPEENTIYDVETGKYIKVDAKAIEATTTGAPTADEVDPEKAARKKAIQSVLEN